MSARHWRGLPTLSLIPASRFCSISYILFCFSFYYILAVDRGTVLGTTVSVESPIVVGLPRGTDQRSTMTRFLIPLHLAANPEAIERQSPVYLTHVSTGVSDSNSGSGCYSPALDDLNGCKSVELKQPTKHSLLRLELLTFPQRPLGRKYHFCSSTYFLYVQQAQLESWNIVTVWNDVHLVTSVGVAASPACPQAPLNTALGLLFWATAQGSRQPEM